MGRDPLGADERHISGRTTESPLKLESDLRKLDDFLTRKQSEHTGDTQKLLVETEESVKNFVENLEKEVKLD
jgi:hypothetical protein